MSGVGKTTAEDLQKVTGLKMQYAKQCFDSFGGYAAALASFAQSYPSLPQAFFDDYELSTKNAKLINDELRVIYRRARELKAKSGKQDEEVWKDYYKSNGNTSTVSAAPAAPPHQPTAVAGVAKPSASPFASSFVAAKPPAAVFPSAFSSTQPATAAFGGFGSTQPPSTTNNLFGSTKPSATVPSAFGAPAPSSSSSANAFGFGNVASNSVPLKSAFGATAPATTAAAAPSAPASLFGAAPAGKSAAGAVPNFGFGSAPAAAAGAAPNFGFGSAPAAAPAPGPTAAPTAMADFGKSQTALTADTAPKKEVKYCQPKHFTGPYFDMPDFWADEVVARAPLLNLNHGFLEAHKDELRPRLEKWVKKASFYRQPVKYVLMEDEDEEIVRVIIKDADRTFFNPVHRAKLVALLNAMYTEFGTYGQAMSYLAGLCMLVLNEQDTATVLRFVSSEYIRGHWAAEAVGFATSAWVVEYFMQKLFPDVAKHLQALNFWPDTYLQKILTGLCIHVLRFNELFDFLDAFMEGGMHYLIRFSLAIVEHFRSDLLAIKSTTEANRLYEIMRLDAHTTDLADVRAILERAKVLSLGDEEDRLSLIRSEVYEKKIAPRLNKAPKTNTFEPCELCEKNRPCWWCEDVGAVCESCKNAHPEHSYEKY